MLGMSFGIILGQLLMVRFWCYKKDVFWHRKITTPHHCWMSNEYGFNSRGPILTDIAELFLDNNCGSFNSVPTDGNKAFI